ncbi:hypothetical protein HYPSUDRAFT_164585 [Hypholoma sublateritium FD-334 SS-4]|uniref:PARP catalytic domain-containing protein n=1 Tax=Hypholoma sublateritium (strain FD-334 SS-4) TaxID=945553 RepID=A0A0D2L671_HYPSF|nr:hypothetical protein HYPSUDRAFT_164585 [Hypholoma sublateritium FD-334 SS-4]
MDCCKQMTLPGSSQYRYTQYRARLCDGERCLVCGVCICETRYDNFTCSLTCSIRLCSEGPTDRGRCTYCLRRPCIKGVYQCSTLCAQRAREACLLCRRAPMSSIGHILCGTACTRALQATWPRFRVLRAYPTHKFYEQAVARFIRAWRVPGNAALPRVQKVLAVVRTEEEDEEHNMYRARIGNVAYTYHGTRMVCRLGTVNQAAPCSSINCSVCCILRTSFKLNKAQATGAFGSAIYTSSASNKAYNYTQGGSGAIIVCRVVLGRAFIARGFGEVQSCPRGYNSVVFDRESNGVSLNETVLYNEHAIRPLQIILF